MTATDLDLTGARAALAALGRRLDELALAGADETILDGILSAMRQAHDRITGHLTAAGTTTPATTAPHLRQQHLQAAA